MTEHKLAATLPLITLPSDRPADLLREALRIDDLRSEYCQQLERIIAEQRQEIAALRESQRARAPGRVCAHRVRRCRA